jgi:hypothetical protein
VLALVYILAALPIFIGFDLEEPFDQQVNATHHATQHATQHATRDATRSPPGIPSRHLAHGTPRGKPRADAGSVAHARCMPKPRHRRCAARAERRWRMAAKRGAA